MAKGHSFGILLHRPDPAGWVELFLAHPGGPYWARRDAGAWTIPKGAQTPGDADGEAAARREFAEETGHAVTAALRPLGAFRQPGGKVIHVWTGTQAIDPATLRSNSFSLEWPPKSGQMAAFPEIDRAGWFAIAAVRDKIIAGQLPIIDALLGCL